MPRKPKLESKPLPAAKPRGGRRSRQKGDRAERGLVKMLQQAGVQALRTPSSGAIRSPRFGGGFDVLATIFDRELKLELKHHGAGFQRLYRWLEPVDILIVKCDYGEPLAVLPINLLLDFARGKMSSGTELNVKVSTAADASTDTGL